MDLSNKSWLQAPCSREADEGLHSSDEWLPSAGFNINAEDAAAFAAAQQVFDENEARGARND